MPGSRVYVVTDPSLATAVQRASKALSFTPLVADLTGRILALDAASVQICRQNLDPEPGEPRGVLADLHDLVYSYLGPGESLNALSKGACRELCQGVNAYAAGHMGQSGETVNLLVWVRRFVIRATARFLYGPRNPIEGHPELEDAFWDFDHGLGALMIGILPSLTARKPYRGREALAKAFLAYTEAEAYKDAGVADIIRRRYDIMFSHGFSVPMAARSELSFLFAGVVNTATTTFWVVLHLFARPDLLRAAREELFGGAVTTFSLGDAPTRLLDLEAIKVGCPTLVSVFRECLRLGSDNYSTRLVKTDTLLAGRHFLRAGSVVQVAGGVIHNDAGIWGPDADKFEPRRFLKVPQGQDLGSAAGGGDGGGNGKEKEKGPQVHPAAFRPFGGGKTLCPGRHFATDEILAFVAMIVLSVDLDPVGGDRIVVPAKEDGVLPVHILEPKTDVNVRVRVVDAREIVIV